MARGSSPILVGRGAELARLRAAVAGARGADRCVILVSGEAGIGKSRLAAELARSLAAEPPGDRPIAVLRGSCIEVGASLAYLPLVELLDDAAVLGPEVAAAAGELRQLLGGAGPARDDEPPGGSGNRAATFLRLHEFVARIAATHDLVLLVDDLQWADRSTLDVLAFLARRLEGSGVVLLLAYRSDELSRRHPLRPLLADVQRRGPLEHIRLEPLDAVAVRRQVAAILGAEPEPARTERIVSLADGNPFHVEELLSLGDDRRLPSSLNDVLGARLDQLDDRSHQVVRRAAVIGRQVDNRLLLAVSSAAAADVTEGLRGAVEARILVADDERHHRFRHALLREAVYGEVPPADRLELHRRIAEVLTDHPELGDGSPTVALADLARHWRAAGADDEAFATLLAAARSAIASTAWAEARGALEEALALWDRVADPVAVAGSPRSRILEQAAEIAWAEGDARRALTLNRLAQSEPDVVADAARLGGLARREAWLLDDLGDLAGEGEAAARAIRLVPAEPPSVDRVLAVSAVGLHALRDGRVADAVREFEHAVEIARSLDAGNELAANLAFLAMAAADLGEVDRPVAFVAELDERLPGIADPLAWSVVTTWTPWVWIAASDYPRAIESADRLLADARSRGLEQGVGLWCLAPRALGTFWLGRWDDALDAVARQGDYAWGIDAAIHLRAVAALTAAGRGDATAARSGAAEAIDVAGSGFPEQAMVALAAAAWVELLDGDPDAALEHVRRAWPATSRWQGQVVRSLVLWTGAWAVAELAGRAGWQDGRLPAAAMEMRRLLRAEIEGALARRGSGASASPDPGWALTLELARAELARASRLDDAREWRSIAERFEALGERPRAALARLREAEAVLRRRTERAEAGEALRGALEHAEAMGATRLVEQVLTLARTSRLEVPGRSPAPTPAPAATRDGWPLSAREREVLALLVDGRTNREIAAALFISDKTASVHITHILDKLGVSSRTEAALLAVRSGLAGIGGGSGTAGRAGRTGGAGDPAPQAPVRGEPMGGGNPTTEPATT